MLTFRSFCSGIEAASCAWEPLGMRCLSVCEVDPQASAVLEARVPGAVNLGDMTSKECLSAIRTGERANVFVAGTPCQSFSVAGLRAGMADPRGNLALVFLGLVDVGRPEYVVWENVPGVLSSGGGRDFGAFVVGMVQLGYGVCWRVLDAQFVLVESHPFAVPQRRRRVFVVGHLGDWRRAAQILFERESIRGHPEPRRAAGQGVAGSLTRGLGSGGPDASHALNGWLTHDVAKAMQARDHKGVNSTMDVPLVVGALSPVAHPGGYNGQDAYTGHLVAHTLRASGHDASEDGTGRGVPIVACFDPLQVTSKVNASRCLADVSPTQHQQPMAIAFQTRIARNGRGQPKDVTDALTSCDAGTYADSKPHVAYSGGVRRLTPTECERLQGFPDGWTQVPWRGKPMADAARYRMLGNSMACNVMSWVGRRILQGGAA